MMLILSSISRVFEFGSVNHMSIYKNSESNDFKNYSESNDFWRNI